MPSSCMQSVQKGEKAYSDGRIAVPDDGILQHQQHFPMARKYHCCSRNDTFIASRSSEKSRPRCSCILHTHISVQAGAQRKAGRICKQPPDTPLFHTARHKESLLQRSFSLAEGGSIIIYFSAVQFTKEGHPGGQMQRILSPPLLLPHAATPLSDGQRMHKACIIPLVQLPSTCQQRLQHLRMGQR